MTDTPENPGKPALVLDYQRKLPVEEIPGNLGSRTASGTVWMAIQTVGSRFTSLLSQLLLARLLMPADFGQIGLVYTITAFAVQLTNPGVDDVLLQKQKHLNRWATSAFWMSLACSLAGSALMIVSAIVVVWFARVHGNAAYGDPALLRMTLIMAISMPLTTAMIVPSVILRSELRFARVASINFGDVLFQQALAVLFAACGFGAYSFVLPLPIAAAARLAVLWYSARPRIKMQLELHRWPSLTSAGGWIFGQRLLATGTSQGDYMILAALYADKVLVGRYFFAFILSTQVIRLLCDNAWATLTSALITIRDDMQRMTNAAHRAAGALATMVVPIVTLQILLAGPVIRVLFAAKWEPAIPLVRWLSAGPLFFWAIWPMGAMLTATGRFREAFFIWLIGAISFFVIVFPATYFGGAIGTAASVAGWCWLMPIVFSLVIYRSTSGIWLLFQAGAVPWFAAAVAAVPSSLIVSLLPHQIIYDLFAILFVTAIVLATYLAVLRRWDRPSVEMFQGYVTAMFSAVRSKWSRRSLT